MRYTVYNSIQRRIVSTTVSINKYKRKRQSNKESNNTPNAGSVNNNKSRMINLSKPQMNYVNLGQPLQFMDLDAHLKH